MNWQKVVLYVLGAIALISLGYLLRSVTIPKPSTIVETKIVTDTTTTVKKIYFTKTRTDTIRIAKEKFTYADSLMGTKDEVDYKIKHSIQSDKEILNFWEVDLEPRLKTIIQYVTKDSVRTIVEAKYISTPFFMQTWFWIALLELPLIIIAIIF